MLDIVASPERQIQQGSDATHDLALRFRQQFPRGLPTRKRLSKIGIFLADEDSVDSVDMCLRLAEIVRSNADTLRNRLMTTTVRSRRALVSALLTFAQAGEVPDNAVTLTSSGPQVFVGTAATGTVMPTPTQQEGYPVDEVQDIWSRFAATHGVDERNKLVEQYLPIVQFYARRILTRLPEGVELGDLVSAGVFGLMDAIDAFDPNRGVKFETYCVPRVRGAMLDELRTMDWVPRLVRLKARKINEATKLLENKLGRTPTAEELAEHMELSVRELEALMTEANATGLISLDKKWYETDSYKNVREIDILQDGKAPHPAARMSRKDVLREVTKGLNRNERFIIIGYYYEDMTMKEIGRALDLTESRVSQIHSSIVARLQAKLPKSALDVIGIC